MPLIDVKVPNIGDFKDVPIIEIQVKPGDDVTEDAPLIVLESDKAAMEVPAPTGGRIAEILVGIGDKVSEGSIIIRLDVADAHVSHPKEMNGSTSPATADVPLEEPRTASVPEARQDHLALPRPTEFGSAHATPSVRRIAREMDVDLTQVRGTGEKGRITKEDVKRHLMRVADASDHQVKGIPDIPLPDFSKFGVIETKPMSRLQKLSGPHLHRSWLNIPHVTNSDEADISELDAYRKKLDESAKAKGYRVSIVAFLMKAAVSALKEYPEMNASISPERDALILKRYYNIGVAVDTPDGLVVPVIRDVDRKGILELSQELSMVSIRVREGRIAPADIQGGTFSISSLGGIGGTNFTPIVNAPEVAILGATRAAMKPVWVAGSFEPRLMLPVCVSYDHRAVDGALAAKFLRKISEDLGDVRHLVL
jgi:pyruvate dehydrogenase E2 component (dihydrolipoamide acetyltransferase)